MPSDQRFFPTMRLRRRADFKRTYERRCTAADGVLLIFANRNGLDLPRLGLSVSRKVGPAVVRNRWKRRLREAFRLGRHELPQGVDFVVIPKSPAEPEFAALRDSLLRLARRATQKFKDKG